MKFLDLVENQAESEVLQLEYEIMELKYRVANWDLLPSAVDFWSGIIAKMESRKNALQAGINAEASS